MVYDVQVPSLRQPHDAPPSRTEETDRHSRPAPSKPAFQESESGNVQAVSWSPAQQKARQQQQQEQQQGEQQQQQPHQRRRGRHVSWPSMDSLADLNLPATAVQTVDRVAKEVVTVFGLAMKLLSYLGLGEDVATLPDCSCCCTPDIIDRRPKDHAADLQMHSAMYSMPA